MPDNDNAGDQIAGNAKRLAEEAAKLGLTLRGYTFAPNLEGGPHMVQAVFSIDQVPDTEPAEGDDTDIVAGFEEMLRGQQQAEQTAAIDTAREVLRRRLAEGGDILDD